MKAKITKTIHKTRVGYSIVELQTGKTFNDTILLDNWLTNITRITNILNEQSIKKAGKPIKVYAITSIEHVSLKAELPVKTFNQLATIDDASIVVIKKLK